MTDHLMQILSGLRQVFCAKKDPRHTYEQKCTRHPAQFPERWEDPVLGHRIGIFAVPVQE